MERTIVGNPIIEADFPDPSVLYRNGTFYMTTTSMHFMPGIPILRSYDLAHWEIASHVYSTFLDNPAHDLSGGADIYGKGSWATSLRYHDGYFYVCFNSNDAGRTFVYRTRNIEAGPWERSILPGAHHDPSLLFDDGGTYLVYGNGSIRIRELTSDAMAYKEGGADRVLVETPRVEGLDCEGSHMHRIGGVYYLLLIQWPASPPGRRIQWCYRSDSLFGAYEGRVVLDDDLGYGNAGVAQGGLFQADGDWYAMLFQDRGALGRCPVLLPVSWEDGWPALGRAGKVPREFEVPYRPRPAAPFVASDEFDYATEALAPVWQWNHNPDNRFWSVTARPGFLRLVNGSVAGGLERARNTLTQRTLGPACVFSAELDPAGMRPGDFAGLAAFQSRFGYVGVSVADGERRVVMVAGERGEERIVESAPLASPTVFLEVRFDFRDGRDLATFAYSADGVAWRNIGEPLAMVFRLDHFVGYRAALFSYGTVAAGGYADFAFMRFRRD